MRKKFLVCILLPCCILIAACGHTADTKNDLLSENITSDTETDTQTSDYEKYNNYGSTEEQMDEAITETSETASSSEENDLPEQSLQKYSDDWDESQILEELQKRNTYHDYCSFLPGVCPIYGKCNGSPGYFHEYLPDLCYRYKILSGFRL